LVERRKRRINFQGLPIINAEKTNVKAKKIKNFSKFAYQKQKLQKGYKVVTLDFGIFLSFYVK